MLVLYFLISYSRHRFLIRIRWLPGLLPFVAEKLENAFFKSICLPNDDHQTVVGDTLLKNNRKSVVSIQKTLTVGSNDKTTDDSPMRRARMGSI